MADSTKTTKKAVSAESPKKGTEKEAAERTSAEKPQYVAYVSTYTTDNKDKFGIRIYDVDMEKGRLNEKDQVEITNSSYVTISHNQKYLYSITDFGVESYRILKGGDLEPINHTVLKLAEDGSIVGITDEVYHKGLGSIAERNFRPHVQCVKMTRDNKYLLAADLGMDHINVYSFDPVRGKIRQVYIIHSEIESAPRHIKFSQDGQFLYIVHELKNIIDVYHYTDTNGEPDFEKIQTISHNQKYLYSITDFGVESYRILKGGDLEPINHRMRETTVSSYTGLITRPAFSPKYCAFRSAAIIRRTWRCSLTTGISYR